MTSIGENLENVRRRIESSAAGAGRDPAGVKLVAVCKRKPISMVPEGYGAGGCPVRESRDMRCE